MALRMSNGSVRPRAPDRRMLADHLIGTGKVQAGALERAEHLASESNEHLVSVLTRLGLISERDLADALSQLLDLPITAAGDYPGEPVLEEQLGKKFLRDARVIPLREVEEGVVIAAANPLDTYATDAVRF